MPHAEGVQAAEQPIALNIAPAAAPEPTSSLPRASSSAPEAQKTAVQLREEEEARDKEETARLEQEFYRVFGAYRRKASTIEWKEHKVCYARLCLYVRMNLNA